MHLVRDLGGWNSEAAVGMSGARFFSLTGSVARLERAISSYFLDRLLDRGYTEVSPPLVVSRSALEGTSQLPKFEEDLFKIVPDSHTCNGEDAFLIPTAEVPLTNMHANQILDEADLPISYCALTPCFRAEAGSYGRDTRGLIRQHQFHKVELVWLTTPARAEEDHLALLSHAETALQRLELPYQVALHCGGETSFSAHRCFDLEVWLPSQDRYREISSVSHFTDFQARRMQLRYRPPPVDGKKQKARLCHTLNGSGLAVGRTLVAILENYQQEDGSVVIPSILRPYMGGMERIEAGH